MKPLIQKLVIIATFVNIYFPTQQLRAQCGAGYTAVSVNFDLQYFTDDTTYASDINFMFGKNIMQLKWAGTNTFKGTTGEHKGQGTSFGAGNDLKYMVGAGSDTLIFDKEVSNLKFSIYDLDNGQAVNVKGTNTADVAQTITMVRDSAVGVATVGVATPTITNSGTTTATATGGSSNVNLTARAGTANITIAGPVLKVILTFTKSSGTDSIYISDISACNNNTTTGTWATNYQAVSTPESGQPTYMLACFGDSIVAINKSTNTINLIYEASASGLSLLSAGGLPKAINSLAYDPYKQIIYFADNARTSTNKTLYKYDVKTNVASVFIADVQTLGIKLFSFGMGSGGASFYDGALFIGQDMGLVRREPVTVYRIDIDPTSGNATKASRVWSRQGYSGTTGYYDWSDFVINDGIFYNFNLQTTLSLSGLEHIGLDNQNIIAGYTTGSMSQVSIDYAGSIFHMVSTAGTATYSLYNGAGGFGAGTTFTGSGTIPLTDAGESFKYPYDFGDAPVGYGVPFHLFKTSPDLMLGAAIDYQINDTTNATADADDLYNTGSADDEEAVTTFPILTTANTSYTVNVRTTNNSDSAANLYGYIDFNRDGDFADAGEQSMVATVAKGTTILSPVAVNWTSLTGGSVGSSFIRFRLATSTAEASNYSGYAGTGEVEDYIFPITVSVLPVELVEFKATANDNKTTTLNWSTASEINNEYFEVQRKQDNTWKNIGRINGKKFSNSLNDYHLIDETPSDGINYYQLKQVDFDGKADYSSMVSVTFDVTNADKQVTLTLYPNPANNEIWIKSDDDINANNLKDIEIFNIVGEKLLVSKMQENIQKIDIKELPKGLYFIKIGTQTYRVLKE